MRGALVAAFGGVVLGALVLTAPASSGDGIKMRMTPGSECAAVLAVHTVRTNGKDARRLTLPCRITGTQRPDCELVERK